VHTSQLLSETSLGRFQLGCIFDNDPNKQGEKLNGIKILNFDGNAKKLKQTIDVIIISSEASEEIIYNQIGYLEDQRVEIVKLYH
jgi:hypothetical protein